MIPCKFCTKPLNPNAKGVRRWVSGWERVRQTGEGVHPLQGRESSNAYAHELCIDIHLAGGSEQPSLAL